jgi:hypothetical protein
MPDSFQANHVEIGSKVDDRQDRSEPVLTKIPPPPKNKGAPRMGRASKLRLLARLHGEGLVILPGSPVPVSYDVDIFAGGSAQTASGFLDGDFAAAYASRQDESTGPAATAARLRLADGGEVAIQITIVAPDLAEFEAPLTSAEADLLSSRR